MILAQADPSFKIAFSHYALDGKIPHGSSLWPKFNSSFANEQLPLIEIANRIYGGHALTTWHSNHWRHGNNYECGQHIGLDYDTEDDHSRLSTLAQEPLIAKYASLIYTTPSHTVDKPKARVIFMLDEPIVQARNYTMAATALLWLFGHADRQCKDPCRFFYGSKDCEIEYLANVLPLAKVRHIIEQYKASGTVARKIHTSGYTAAPDQREVYDALQRIPAWGIDYDEWLAVLMAIHSAFGEDGLCMAESWAQEGYNGEVARKWRSFHDSGNTTGKVTIGTLFALAKRYGWQRPV